MSALLKENLRAPSSPFDAIAHVFEVRETKIGRALFACQPIARGTPLFSEDDWVDETEARASTVLTPPQLDNLTPALRSAFIRYGYNTALDRITGTFHPEAVRHPRDGGKTAFDPGLAALESKMELPECVFRQESGGTAGCVDLKSPRADQIGGPLEGL